MKKSVLTAFITVVCATSSVMAADDNAITDGSGDAANLLI